jgi:hypothetical protein
MIYVYPTVQSVVAGSVFIMADTFDSGKYDKYVIKYHGQNGVDHMTLSHAAIEKAMQDKLVIRARRQSFANYKEFIKIPTYVASNAHGPKEVSA